MLKPLKSGLYMVNQEMLSDLKSEKYGEHSSNLGALIAQRIAAKYGKKAYILDSVCVDDYKGGSIVGCHKTGLDMVFFLFLFTFHIFPTSIS